MVKYERADCDQRGNDAIHTTAKFYQKIRTEVLKDTVDKMRRTGTSK